MIIWIASYPKSGNTWIRAIVSSLLYTKDGIFNFDLINKVAQYPKRVQFKNFTNDYLDLNKISKYWILTQEKINSDGKLRIFKTHNGNYNFSGNNFTNKNNTLAVIHIVRDPRNIITSISNFYELSLEQSTNFLLTEKKTLNNKNSKNPKDDSGNNIINLLGSWKNHYNSWKIASNSILIRYEDLLNDPISQINKLSLFLSKFGKFETDNKKINNILKSTSFEVLKKKEEKHGFHEVPNSNIKFFYLGPKNNWRNFVDEKLIYRLEKNFKKEMKELNYIS